MWPIEWTNQGYKETITLFYDLLEERFGERKVEEQGSGLNWDHKFGYKFFFS